MGKSPKNTRSHLTKIANARTFYKAATVGWHGQFSAETFALGVNLFGELSVLRSNERIGDGESVLSLLRNTDTFAE